MAVAAPKSISDYRRHYRRTTLIVISLSQLIVALGAGLILLSARLMDWHQPVFWLSLSVIFLLGIGIASIAMNLLTEPMKDILDALSHKIGEPSDTTPPNPNVEHRQKTGLKRVLEAIYEKPNQAINADQSSHVLMQALAHTSWGVVILDPAKQIISANSAAPIATHQDGTQYLALDFLDDQSLTSWLEQCDASAIAAERSWQRIATDPTVVAETKFYDIVASYQKGAPSETIILLIDKSVDYQPEEDDLNFIAFAAHELRGPITVIRGYLDVLEQELADHLSEDDKQLLKRLELAANRLSGYVNNILSVAKFDRHHLQVYLVEDSVAHIYASIADDMQMRAAAQHRLLSVNIPDDLPTVAADRGSIGEVIANLIDNAIKYSFEGGVVAVSAVTKGDFVEISVKDNGIGMPASVVKNLFHKFYRSHRSRESVAGTGIGLYICKAFVESHGGSISASSQENEGSTFSFTLPIYATVKDKLLENGQLNRELIRRGGGWIKNHTMYRS